MAANSNPPQITSAGDYLCFLIRAPLLTAALSQPPGEAGQRRSHCAGGFRRAILTAQGPGRKDEKYDKRIWRKDPVAARRRGTHAGAIGAEAVRYAAGCFQMGERGFT